MAASIFPSKSVIKIRESSVSAVYAVSSRDRLFFADAVNSPNDSAELPPKLVSIFCRARFAAVAIEIRFSSIEFCTIAELITLARIIKLIVMIARNASIYLINTLLIIKINLNLKYKGGKKPAPCVM